MPLYAIKIIDKNKKLREYNKEYTDIGTMKNAVRQDGALLVEFKEKKAKQALSIPALQKLRKTLASRSVGDEDIYNLFYELGIILKAGVPIMKAISMIKEETTKEGLKQFLESISFHLKEGKNISDILEMKENKRHFNFTPFVPVLRMGEKTGKLGESFLNISANIEKWMKIKSEITNALIYPIVLILFSLMAIFVMLVYVIPRFDPIVKNFKVALPFHTKILFGLSTFLSNNQDIVIGAVIILLIALLALSKNPKFKEFGHAVTNKLPIIRSIKFSSENLHFLNSLSNLLSGGVPILSALNLALDSFSSVKVKYKLQQAVQSLRKGDSLAKALKETAVFPDIVANMVRVGEESGTLPEVLQELYSFLSQRFLKQTKKYMNLLEPLVIAFIAIFIGGLIMTIVPIIINISDVNM
ncbi:MAG: type II secretion system F family protein [bacterium]|nr:type II secretion system F family protein [bacterium]